MEGDDRLMVQRLHGNRIERLVARCFGQGFGIGAIGLVAVQISGDIPGVEERDIVAEALEHARPVVSGTTRLQDDPRGRTIYEEARKSSS